MQSVYSLDTLHQACSGSKPAKLAVLGHPIAHSASPQLHQPALDAFGIDASYIRLEVMPGDLSKAFTAMQELGFIGCNVTVPHKFEALETCTEVAAEARILGSVNTVVFRDKGAYGYNTDGPGILQAITEAFDTKAGEIHTLILGAGGGAGQAISTQYALAKPSKLTLVNRSLDKIEILAERLRVISPDTVITTLGFDDPALAEHCHEADLLLQTTSLGLKKSDPAVLSENCFRSGHFAYDTIYQPPVTPFLAAAQRAGCKTDNGLSLLIHQGAIAFQHWFPGTAPLPYMRTAMQQHQKGS